MPSWICRCFTVTAVLFIFGVMLTGCITPAGNTAMGAVKGIDSNTGEYFDDTKKYVDQLDLSENDRHKLFEGNARRVFPRLDQRLRALGL